MNKANLIYINLIYLRFLPIQILKKLLMIVLKINSTKGPDWGKSAEGNDTEAEHAFPTH